MLDCLGGSDQGRVQHALIVDVAGDFAGFVQDTVNGRAIDARGFDAVHLEHFFEAHDLAFGLGKVRFKAVPERLISRFLDHVGKAFRDLLFCIVDVTQRMNEEIVECFDIFGEKSHFVLRVVVLTHKPSKEKRVPPGRQKDAAPSSLCGLPAALGRADASQVFAFQNNAIGLLVLPFRLGTLCDLAGWRVHSEEIIMRALCWHGKGDVRVDTVPDPKIQHPRDAVIKITACAICGSDLHLLDGYQPTMESGDILGHENMGEVIELGSEVTNLKVGDRVVVPFTISCGQCWFCEKGLFSCCDRTNPNAELAAKAMGQSPAGLFGFSHMLGGYSGGQAEYLRVPMADVGPIKNSRQRHR